MKQITDVNHPNPKKKLGLLSAAVLFSLALIASACSSSGATTEAASTADPPVATVVAAAPAVDRGTPEASATPTPTAAPIPGSSESVTPYDLEAFVDQLVTSDFDGVVAVRNGSEITTLAYGTADRENDVPVDTETVFDIGSLTKQFTGAAILRLEMDGRLSVDDTLGEHVPGLPSDKAAITLHQLLTHTAGLPVGLGPDDEPVGRSDYLARVAETPLTSEPGDRYEYSNIGYSLLGAVIEFATGESYETYLRTALFEPIGMLATGYVLPDWDEHTIAVGYDNPSGTRFGRPNEQPWDVDGPYWNLLGNGGLLSTAADMLRWDQALQSNDVLDETAKAKLFGAHVPLGPDGDVHYGYGWLIIQPPTGTPLITHDGGNHVFYADFLRLTDHDVSVFMTTNSTQDADGDVVSEVANHVLGGELAAMFESDGNTGNDSDAIADLGTCADTLPNVEMECGQLAVPVDYDEPGSDTISLPYVVLPALGDNPAAEPLVYLEGGPGFSTMPAVTLFVEAPEFRQDRDIIFLEQRGADPFGIFLDCPSDLADRTALQTCRDSHVSNGIDLSAFTTLNAAKDLAMLRAHLGIERWHLLGTSYGTTLAMVAMDNDAEGTASVILDGPTAPDVIIYNADAESLLDAPARVFVNCAADSDCSQRYPDLFDTHIANYQRLLDEPWSIENTELAELTDVVDHELYLTVSFEMVVGQPSALPAFVTAVAERDPERILELLEATNGADSDPTAQEIPNMARAMAIGLNLSIYCAEEAPFLDLETNPIDTANEWPSEIVDAVVDSIVGPVDTACEVWNVNPADPNDVDQITSAIPTLILAGEYDHTTPIRQGEIAAAGLSTSELIEVPSTGHTTIVNDCARRIMVDFLRAPGGDRSCLADIAPIEWQ